MNFRQKTFKGAGIEDTIIYIENLSKQHREYLELYRNKCNDGDDNAKLFEEFHRGMTVMADTIKTNLESKFSYEKNKLAK